MNLNSLNLGGSVASDRKVHSFNPDLLIMEDPPMLVANPVRRFRLADRAFRISREDGDHSMIRQIRSDRFLALQNIKGGFWGDEIRRLTADLRPGKVAYRIDGEVWGPCKVWEPRESRGRVTAFVMVPVESFGRIEALENR